MSATSPEDADRLFGEYVNAGDLDSLVGLYESDAVLGQQDGSVVAGHTAIRESLSPLLDARPTISMHVVRVVRAGDIATLYNDWTVVAKGLDGSSIEMQGKAIEVVRRQSDGTWKFIIDDPWARG